LVDKINTNLYLALSRTPEASFIILDRSALIDALPSRMSKTFEEYAVLEIVPKVQGYSCTYMRRYCV
jgi:hypothetical protein